MLWLSFTSQEKGKKPFMALTVDTSFFVSFVEETIQTSCVDIKLSPCALVGNIPDNTFDATKLVCTKLCPILFGDSTAKLKKKDDRNFVVITKTFGIYSVYKQDNIVYKQKSQALFKVYASIIQGMFAKCMSEPHVFVAENNECSYIHLMFDT